MHQPHIDEICESFFLLLENEVDPTKYFSEFESSHYQNYGILVFSHALQDILQIDENTFILSFIYLNRVGQEIAITDKTIYILLVLSVLHAMQWNDYTYVDMKNFSVLAGKSLQDFRVLQAIYLERIDFNLFVSEVEFCHYKNSILGENSN